MCCDWGSQCILAHYMSSPSFPWVVAGHGPSPGDDESPGVQCHHPLLTQALYIHVGMCMYVCVMCMCTCKYRHSCFPKVCFLPLHFSQPPLAPIFANGKILRRFLHLQKRVKSENSVQPLFPTSCGKAACTHTGRGSAELLPGTHTPCLHIKHRISVGL